MLEKEILKYEVIFFDIFDTLVKRVVKSDEQIFQLVADSFQNEFKKTIDFVRLRKEADQRARGICKYREVNIEEIYQHIKIDNQAYKDYLIQKEIEFQIKVTVQNAEIYEIYNLCRKMHKRIFIVTDMYLPNNVIEKILDKNGYADYEGLYNSCEYRLTKWEGGYLFRKVIEDNNLSKCNILHIGDNKHADFEMARKQGLSSCWYKKKNLTQYDARNFLNTAFEMEYEKLERFMNAALTKRLAAEFRVGYEVFGPLLSGYLQWIIKIAKEQNVKRVLFFSRDGYVVSKAYKNAVKDVIGDYFYVSRRSVIVPELHKYNSISGMMTLYKSWPKEIGLEHLLQKFGLDFNNYEYIIISYGFDRYTRFCVDDIRNNRISDLDEMFKELLPYIVDNSLKELALLKSYFEQENVNGRVGIVDMGAGCSIEMAIKPILESFGCEIVPLYVHTALKNNEKRFYYLDSSRGNRLLFSGLRFCYMLLELFFSAPHGTVVKYKIDNGKIIPVCETYEFESEGQYEKEHYMVSTLHQGALSFVKDFNDYHWLVNITPDIAVANFLCFGVQPKLYDAILWGDVRFSSDEFSFMAKPEGSFLYYLIHPKEFVIHIKSSLWIAGFLTRIFQSNLIGKILFRVYYGFRR